ncbi:hypothetical protein TRFO_36073 [Tritrichomonas foetus]|uniref:Uncharacterized protein n=1 Tax=Tritrichomonas foetus TaxID=1144522 RepID=A0A1J4JEY1_9EUKA|nr:hypothetical protein TRFO_36073 [Tritrichomonas foetus]|eukprot:OHS97698.1 hypothetical protein TRFO_36073 [Tritrichomonas foetus]
MYVKKKLERKFCRFFFMSTSSTISKKAKDLSHLSDISSVGSVSSKKTPRKHTPKNKNKKIKKKTPETFSKINFLSSSNRQKDLSSFLDDDNISTIPSKSVFNVSVSSKRFDTLSTMSKRRSSKKSSSKTPEHFIIKLPPPSKPNFFRKNQQYTIEASFDDRWQEFLEMKKLDNARNQIYFFVYFRKWKAAASRKLIERIKERTASFESIKEVSFTSEVQQSTNNEESAIDLINKARRKMNEYHSFISNIEGQTSNIFRTPQQNRNDSSRNENTELNINSDFRFDGKSFYNKNYQNSFHNSSPNIEEFEFTDSSDNTPRKPNVYKTQNVDQVIIESDDSENGSFKGNDTHMTNESITVANSFCEMVDSSINKSRELAKETKRILADDSQDSSEIEFEIKDHSFINERKRRYISGSSSSEEEIFLPKMLLKKKISHNSSLADSFQVSPSTTSNFDLNRSLNYQSDILENIPSKKVHFVSK